MNKRIADMYIAVVRRFCRLEELEGLATKEDVQLLLDEQKRTLKALQEVQALVRKRNSSLIS